MKPYVLKWEGDIGRLFRDEADLHHQSIALIFPTNDIEKESLTRYYEVANLEWSRIQGLMIDP